MEKNKYTHAESLLSMLYGEEWQNFSIVHKTLERLHLALSKKTKGAIIRENLMKRRQEFLEKIYKANPHLRGINDIQGAISKSLQKGHGFFGKIHLKIPNLKDVYIHIIAEPNGWKHVILSERLISIEELKEASDFQDISGYIGLASFSSISEENGMNLSFYKKDGGIDAIRYPFEHKGVHINEHYRGKQIGPFLYHIHDVVFGYNSREMAKSYEMAQVYISLGFIPTGVYGTPMNLPKPENPNNTYTDALIPEIFKMKPDSVWAQFYRPKEFENSILSPEMHSKV